MKQITKPVLLAVGILVILLLASFVFQLANHPETGTYPSSESVLPSGTAAFAELLGKDGYKVRLEKNSLPKLALDDIPVVYDSGTTGFMGMIDSSSKAGDIDKHWGAGDNGERLGSVLLDHVNKGGKVLIIGYPSQFDTSDANAVTADFHTGAGKDAHFKVTQSKPTHEAPTDVSSTFGDVYGKGSEEVTFNGDGDKADATSGLTVSRYGKGLIYTIPDGIFTTNHYITSQDNAAYALNTLERIAPLGSKLDFAEAGIGNAAPFGLLESLGPFSSFAKFQVFALFVLLVFCGAIRFGAPLSMQERQRGTREMVDAMGSNLARVQPTFSLELLVNEGYERVRSALKLPVFLDHESLREYMPDDLKSAFAASEEVSHMKATGFFAVFEKPGLNNRALNQANLLDHALTRLEQDTRRRVG